MNRWERQFWATLSPETAALLQADLASPWPAYSSHERTGRHVSGVWRWDTFKPGDRVLNRRDEKATVVARAADCPADATPVVYDGDDHGTIWHTLTIYLRPLREDV